MDLFGELVATNHWRALEYLLPGLQNVSEPTVNRQELLYKMPAFSRNTPRQGDVDVPIPADLGAFFDNFVIDQTLLRDSVRLEAAGPQCPLLAGFFEDHMRRRHTSAGTLNWAQAFQTCREAEQSPAKPGCLTRSPNIAPASCATQPRAS
jgi:hypothetical protein